MVDMKPKFGGIFFLLKMFIGCYQREKKVTTKAYFRKGSYELCPINISRGKLSLSLHLSLSSPHQRTHLHQWRLGHTLYNSYKNNKLIKFKAQKNHKYNDVSARVILLFTYTTTILAFSVFRRKQTKNDNFTLHLNNYPKWGIKLIPSCVINRKIQHGRSDRSNLLWF